ncbi:MAG: putative 2-aminoethylphosphonate ABC transporter substrate-binding protein [Alphaproteobacteria bacterium]|nr:putative 2-aminoethylphosphonate ABC transporter substrate-binding protein [Alphaproteobacteria bacterium]
MQTKLTRRGALLLATLTLAGAIGSGPATAATELVVYTALEADQIKAYKEGFEKQNPDITIKLVRDSTGIITARLLAEKANPQADVVWRVAATSLMLLDQEGMLDTYAPKGLEAVTANFRDPKSPPAWTGMDAWMATVAFNTVEAQKRNLPKPESWKDLAKPIYKGALVMPNPNSSGTGYLMVSSWLQLFGEAEGWKFMDALHDNMAVYTHSGSKPARMAATGEYPIGFSFEYRASSEKAKGAPIDLVFPKEGLGWDMEATAILKGSKRVEAARKLVDFSVSREANEFYAKNFAVVALPGVAKPLPHLPETIATMMIKNDFAWAAKNRERILKEWQTRYDGKSEPKS